MIRSQIPTLSIALILLSFLMFEVNATTQDDFESLFDGTSLDGWIARGGKARYTVEDGAILGTSVPGTPNTFLCTERLFGDFVLEYEFLVDRELNSGVQIRSNSLPDYQNGRVHGYQVEIDPDTERNRMWSAGIYDEGRRGWLNSLASNKPAREAFKPGEWNHVRVEAHGDSITTWINGVAAADLVDSMTLDGFIGLQVHGVGNREDPLHVRWRNLKIRDLGKCSWQPLHPGDGLAGWTAEPGGSWKVTDGALTATASGEAAHLTSRNAIEDFTLQFDFLGQNARGSLDVAGQVVPIDPEHGFGGENAEAKKHHRPGQWNRLTVSAHGKRFVVHLNHRVIVDRRDVDLKKERLRFTLTEGQLSAKSFMVLGDAKK